MHPQLLLVPIDSPMGPPAPACDGRHGAASIRLPTGLAGQLHALRLAVLRLRIGAPDWIRTSDLRLRRATLYPAELRARGWPLKRGRNHSPGAPASPFGTRGVGAGPVRPRRTAAGCARHESPRYTSRPVHPPVRSSTVSAEHDRKFFDTFMLILGILAAITIGLMVLAGVISDRTAKQFPGRSAQAAGNPGTHRPGRARRSGW
jgi:hypothetical protein